MYSSVVNPSSEFFIAISLANSSLSGTNCPQLFNGKPKATVFQKSKNAVAFGLPLNEKSLTTYLRSENRKWSYPVGSDLLNRRRPAVSGYHL